ncbi:hypothetical protein FHS21_004169 [Phyllobacterium trifolii]|uniref:Uncharacterized protein n=1 Tax=Phyllobacterium trifolii TaxID=300193 RepID=A0A839UB38_9HYPH|nr:hypothetical protein [Phyllobacterium trifolii]MBB3147737.1 hypothetical protein [Phyllobacterium trifolii]
MNLCRTLAVLSLLLIPVQAVGFATPALAEELRWPTDTERSQIVAAIRDTFPDPYSIRDAELSQMLAFDQGGFVCLYANSKNRFGGYSGRQYSIVGVRFAEKRAEIHPAVADDIEACKKLAFRAFAELSR